MTAICLGPGERAGLRAYLRRLLDLDARADVRVQARGQVVGVWAAPPFQVLTIRPVRLAEPLESNRTVPASRLLDALDGVDDRVPLPDSVVSGSWAAVLPPQSGWELVAEVPVGVVTDQVGVMVEGFHRRANLLPAGGRTTAALDEIARDLWSGPSVGPVPMRAAHAAAALAMLGREGAVTAWRSASWLRLSCPGGSVLVRADGSVPGGGVAAVDVLGAFGARS